jgi:hypothetical protein
MPPNPVAKCPSKAHEASKHKVIKATQRGQQLLRLFLTDRMTAFDKLFAMMYAAHRNLQAFVGVKGLDFLAADNASFRSKPLYRVIVSGSPLKPEARRFAVQWGILAIEPDRLPLLSLHWLAGRQVPHLYNVDEHTQDLIWREIPHLVTPLQDRVSRLSEALDAGAAIVSRHRIERALKHQRVAGDYYWMALEEAEPTWLEERYDRLHRQLHLDGGVDCGPCPTSRSSLAPKFTSTSALPFSSASTSRTSMTCEITPPATVPG